MNRAFLKTAVVGVLLWEGAASVVAAPALTSIDTGLTISKVCTARVHEKTVVVASSYEGTVLGIDPAGKVLWKNALSGLMNHDLYCGDLTGDGSDEVLAANADGSIYCLNDEGRVLWSFKENDAPMYSVCIVHKDGQSYVACGGFDKNLYYLSAKGRRLKTIPSSSYSQEKGWNWYPRNPKIAEHTVNFIRPLKQKDGREILTVIGQISQISAGSIYQFDPLADAPFKKTKMQSNRVIGSFNTSDLNGDGAEELLLGTTGSLDQNFLVQVSPDCEKQELLALKELRGKVEHFGYRVAQPALIEGDSLFYILFGTRTVLLRPGAAMDTAEVLSCQYSFNDMCKDPASPLVVLASAQSGGSAVHLLDTSNPAWKKAYETLTPPGKIQHILDNTAQVRAELEVFNKPKHERDPLPVYLMSDSYSTALAKATAENIIENYNSPIFLGGKHQSKVEGFDRSVMGNERYEKKRDRRKKYVLSQQEALDALVPQFEGQPGIAYWGGHGNDPNYYQVSTTKKVFDAAQGKKTVLIYPEIQDHTDNFAWLMNYLMYPLAEYGQGRNANIYVRSKNNFWHGDIYMPGWSRLVSGEFADVFVPALEESHSKIQDMSVAARVGMWTSGAVDSWGARCARDNTSFDRTREHSHQMLPNHFLRQMIYDVSCGAQYLDNFPVDQDYMSVLWELIAKGALYVPKREELVSLNPVFLGMKDPDHRFLDEGGNVHWTVFYDQKEEQQNPMVFGHMNGSWKGAGVTEWDFSRYAAGVTERRLNLLPSYPNGLVMIAPPQAGVFADLTAPRGKMVDHLHPLYRSIMQEYITDGRNYYSADGQQTYSADRYYKTVAQAIVAGAQKLPVTVAGDQVAWVAAQSAPHHLRLTLVDGGYINPAQRTATIRFNTIQPVKITDVLSGKTVKLRNPNELEISVPVGLFRFLDVQFDGEIAPQK